MQGVVWGKVLEVLAVGKLIAHVHVQQQGGLVSPGERKDGGGGHTCEDLVEHRLSVHVSTLPSPGCAHSSTYQHLATFLIV